MSVTTATTPQQFAAAFSEAMAGKTPASTTAPTVTELLRRHRKTLQGYLAKGYTPEQIVEGLKHPTIGITVGANTVKRALAAKPKRKRKAPIKYTAILPNGVVVTSDDVVEPQAPVSPTP